MAGLLDKLSKRGLQRMGQAPEAPLQQPKSPLPGITETISAPPVGPSQTASISQRLANTAQRGAVGGLPQNSGTQKRFLADLPAKVQIQGITDILGGQDSTSPIVNNFVKGMAAQGKNPEEIRQAFLAQQKTSTDPLALL